MTIDQRPFGSKSLLPKNYFSKSHRTAAEQVVGLGLYLFLSFATELFASFSSNIFGMIYAASWGLGMWSIWRLYSLKSLKIELSVFLAQLGIQSLWILASKELLLSLVVLLLLWSNALMATMLFWKKEKLSGIFLFFPVVCIFIHVGMKMFTCMALP